jgi:chromosome segregation ATPase
MRAALLLLLTLAVPGAPLADEARLQEALKRLQAANQRLAADKAQLERERARLEQERGEAVKARDALEGKLKSSRGVAAKSGAELEKSQAANQALESRLTQAAVREEALKTKLAETETTLAQSRRDAEALSKRIANQSATIGIWQAKAGDCEARNGELARLGNELAERYRAKTCEDIGAENEPFTGIRRARMESLLDEYREKMRAQRFDRRQDTASTEARK